MRQAGLYTSNRHTTLFRTHFGGQFQSLNDLLGHAQERRVGSLAPERGAVAAQPARELLLHRNRQALILLAEEIHAGQVVPGFVRGGLQERGGRDVLELGDPFLLLLGREVTVEDGLLFRGIGVIALFSISVTRSRSRGC